MARKGFESRALAPIAESNPLPDPADERKPLLENR
jgi:hypothetical protein